MVFYFLEGIKKNKVKKGNPFVFASSRGQTRGSGALSALALPERWILPSFFLWGAMIFYFLEGVYNTKFQNGLYSFYPFPLALQLS